MKEFHSQNPRTWIGLMTQDACGEAIEATLSVNPMRDGGAGASLVKVTFPDGHSLNTRQ